MGNSVRWTPEQYEELLRRRSTPVAQEPKPKASESPVVSAMSAEDAKVLRAHQSKERWQAKGRLPKDVMNDTEAAYAAMLDQRIQAGEIKWWKFHAIKVRLADRTWYEVDFLVMAADDTLEIHETKGGYTSDKGQLKIKLCAEVLPIARMVKVTKLKKKDGGGWKYEDF